MVHGGGGHFIDRCAATLLIRHRYARTDRFGACEKCDGLASGIKCENEFKELEPGFFWAFDSENSLRAYVLFPSGVLFTLCKHTIDVWPAPPPSPHPSHALPSFSRYDAFTRNLARKIDYNKLLTAFTAERCPPRGSNAPEKRAVSGESTAAARTAMRGRSAPGVFRIT
jgi:hypothetical protein